MLTITYHQYSSQTVKQSDTVRENTGYFFCPNRSAASRCSTGFEWRLSWQRLGLVFTSQEKGLLRCPNRVVLRENLETGNEKKKKGPESKLGSIIIPNQKKTPSTSRSQKYHQLCWPRDIVIFSQAFSPPPTVGPQLRPSYASVEGSQEVQGQILPVMCF